MSDVLEQEPITYLERGTRMWVELGTPDAPELVQWTSWLPHPWMTSFVRYHQSYAVLSNQGAVLIDPWEPVESAQSAFFELIGDKLAAVVITNAWHERGAYDFRGHYGIPVYAPVHGTEELEGQPDELYGEKDILPGALKVQWTGDEFGGDSILYWQSPNSEQVLFAGDAVQVQFRQPLAERPRYQPGLKRSYGLWQHRGETFVRESLSQVLRLEFTHLYGAHNPVPLKDPKAALTEILDEGEYVERSFRELDQEIGRCYLMLREP